MSALHPQLVPPAQGEGASPTRSVGPDAALDDAARRWGDLHGFEGKPGQLLVVPDAEGGVSQVLVGAGRDFDPMSARGLSARLPGGLYRLEAEPEPARQAALAFLLGTYVFDRYKARTDKAPVRLVAPEGLGLAETSGIAAAARIQRMMLVVVENRIW